MRTPAIQPAESWSTTALAIAADIAREHLYQTLGQRTGDLAENARREAELVHELYGLVTEGKTKKA